MSNESRPASPGTEPAEQWVKDISTRSGVPIADVKLVLDRYNIAPARALPPKRRLSIGAVHFAGVKDLAIDGHQEDRRHVPFSFTHNFAPGLTAFGTRNENEAGKSSLLEVIIWGIRGRCNLQRDVRRWIQQAAIEISLAGDRIVIGWTVDNGRPIGRVLLCEGAFHVDWESIDGEALAYFSNEVDRRSDDFGREAGQTYSGFNDEMSGEEPLARSLASFTGAGAIELAEFNGDGEFEAVISALMLDRLGFQSLPQWQKAPAKARVDETDGSLSEHGWGAWSQALIITNPAIKIPLGEENFVAARLLQVYLGTAWAGPAAVAAARKSQLESRMAVLRRRAASVDAERTASLRELEDQAQDLTDRLAQMPESNAAAEADRLLREIASAAEAYAAAQEAHVTAATEYGASLKLLEGSEADEYALVQAAVTRRFWHSLKPSCCPRCDATVDENRWQRELEGHCSLCGSGIDLTAGHAEEDGQPEPLNAQDAARVASEGADLDLDDLDDLSTIRLQIAQLQAGLSVKEAFMDAAKEARDAGRIRLEAASQAGSAINGDAVGARHEAELALARVQGQLAERARTGGDGPDARLLGETRQALIVVTAAAEVTQQRRNADQEQMLADVSARVTDLGRRLGIAQLERATLRGNLTMPVVKGGQRHNFSSLTEGEVLRLKIAVVIALLRVGTSAGVGRHPGLLIIDSLGREELNPDDLATMLRELQQIALEAQLQIVTTSAYGDVLEQALPRDSLRLAGPGERMW